MRAYLARLILWLLAAVAFSPQTALAQRAGDLISAQPADDAPADMRAWRIQYWTTGDDNRLIAVTGMVIAPANRFMQQGAAPGVIAWTHGLIGIAQRCAPSIGTTNFTLIPGLSDVIARGYTVVAPDYPGLGSDMVHPVLVGTSEGRSVLDAVRAHRAIPGADGGTRFAVWGESQGGHAALWTGQLWRDYAPDLELVGIAAIVPPTDLQRNFNEGSDARVRAMLTSYAAASWSRYYNAPMSTFGSRSTQNVMLRLADNNCVQFHAKPRLGTILGILTVQRAIRRLDLGKIEPWDGLMRENSPSPAAIPVPALIATGLRDVIVALAVVEDFARQACAQGKQISFFSFENGEHATVARTEAKTIMEWIAARFARYPAPVNCGQF